MWAAAGSEKHNGSMAGRQAGAMYTEGRGLHRACFTACRCENRPPLGGTQLAAPTSVGQREASTGCWPRGAGLGWAGHRLGGSAGHAGGTVTAGAALRVVQGLNFQHLGSGDALQDELRHAVAALDCTQRGAGGRWRGGWGVGRGGTMQGWRWGACMCAAAGNTHPGPGSVQNATGSARQCTKQRLVRHGACPPARLTLEGRVAVVEQHHAHLAAVVLVHHAGARVDKVLDGQARPRRHARVRAGRARNLQARLHDGAAAGRHLSVFAAAGREVEKDGLAGRQGSRQGG